MIDLAQRYKGIVFYNPAECRCLMDIRTVELIKKDLEDYEELKKVLGKPIQVIMKDLKILEILKKNYACSTSIKANSEITFHYRPTFDIQASKEQEIIKEWLGNDTFK